MSTDLPFRAARSSCRLIRPQRTCVSIRPFSSSRARQIYQPPPSSSFRRALMELDPQKAPTTRKGEAMQTAQEGLDRDDIGMFAGTFIRGAAPRLSPSGAVGANTWKESLGTRRQYEWKYLKTRFMDFVGKMHYKWWIRKGPIKSKPKLNRRGIIRKAEEQYESLYKALAAKDRNVISDICTSGLQTELSNRIASRPDHLSMSWKLLKHVRKPRIVSNRATQFANPAGEDKRFPNAIRQVVLRMHTRQRLVIDREDPSKSQLKASRPISTWTPDGPVADRSRLSEVSAVPDTHEQDVVEYVVLQRFMRQGSEKEWKVWGFTAPTTMEKIAEDANYLQRIEEYDAAHPTAS